MSRSAKIRSVVRRVAAAAGIAIEADYEQHGTMGEWRLRWCDGPTVDMVTAMVKKQARGYVTPAVVDGLRYSRDVTARALAAAFVQRVLDGEQLDAYDATGIAAATPFPDGVTPRAWEFSDFALAHTGISPRSTWDYDSRPALDYLVKVGRDALMVDFWLAREGEHPECQPKPPALDLDTPAARDAVAELYRVLQHQLLGRSAHAGDHRARQLAAQAIRHAVPAMLADCQRADAAAAVVDGWGLRSLGRAVGLGDRTLSKSLGSLDEQVRTQTWLRDHVDEWVAACRGIARAVYPDRHLLPPAWLLDTETLRSAHSGHRALADTVPAARRMIAIEKLWSRTNQEHRDTMAALLAELDRAELPTSRERHSRKGIPALTVERTG
ncbi:hypothetical protein [Amycolatopsis sp. NPDC004378]